MTWAVTGGTGSGTIDANGLYTAPATVPNPAAVTVTATSTQATYPGLGDRDDPDTNRGGHLFQHPSDGDSGRRRSALG